MTVELVKIKNEDDLERLEEQKDRSPLTRCCIATCDFARRVIFNLATVSDRLTLIQCTPFPLYMSASASPALVCMSASVVPLLSYMSASVVPLLSYMSASVATRVVIILLTDRVVIYCIKIYLSFVQLKQQNPSLFVDTVSRYIFPTAYVIFNVIYWPYYYTLEDVDVNAN